MPGRDLDVRAVERDLRFHHRFIHLACHLLQNGVSLALVVGGGGANADALPGGTELGFQVARQACVPPYREGFLRADVWVNRVTQLRGRVQPAQLPVREKEFAPGGIVALRLQLLHSLPDGQIRDVYAAHADARVNAVGVLGFIGKQKSRAGSRCQQQACQKDEDELGYWFVLFVFPVYVHTPVIITISRCSRCFGARGYKVAEFRSP